MGIAKGALTSLDKQMHSVRQVDIWAKSIRGDYEKKLNDMDDYVRNGNKELDTLREAVESNFVRKYLQELRTLSEGYRFEFDSARKAEMNIDERIVEERKKLENLFEEGRKISYLFESRSHAPEGFTKFSERKASFDDLDALSSRRSSIEQLIAQVVGPKHSGEYEMREAKPRKAAAKASAHKAVKGAKKGKK
jgi:hypothetical protein